ncbi:CPBP family intramembrane glutamic endopeptidase [Microbacteriaceae bacterium 4G12]
MYVPLSLGVFNDSISDMISDTLVFFAFPLLWLLYKSKKNNLQFKSFFDKPTYFDWKLVFIVTIMGMLFSFGISTIQFYVLSHLIPDFLLDLLNSQDIIDNHSVFTAIYGVISVAVYAPIMEEIIFRGFFLNRMAYKWGIKKAIIFSSLLFGLGHTDVIGATIFGIVMCLVYLKTRSLLMTMAVHALNNFSISLFQIVFDATKGEAEPTKISDLQSTTELMIGIGLVIVSLLWLVPFIRKNWRTVTEKGLPELKAIHPEQVQSIDNGVYSQVMITNQAMAVELPDEIVNQLKLEEDDYVKLEMQGNHLIVTKTSHNQHTIS